VINIRNRTHAIIAFLVAIPLYSIGVDMTSLIAFYFSSILPDVFEPATHWTHRGVFHSKRALIVTGSVGALGIIIGLITGAYMWPFFIFAGYALHLLGDSLTPVGLPP